MDDYMFGKVVLHSTEDIVRCSFLVRKSLTPLDLNTLEFSYLTPTPFTDEGFQKENGVEGRRVLFEYHLDVSHGLEKAMKEYDPDLEYDFEQSVIHSSSTLWFETNVYRGVKISAVYDYFDYIYPCIIEAIKNSPNKMAKLKKFFPLMKTIRISSGYLEDYWFRDLSLILQEECTDSELVAEFIEACGKIHFIDYLMSNEEEIGQMEYFLHHSQKRKIEMTFEMYCPVSISLLMGKFKRAIALIKYGKMMPPEDICQYKYFSLFCSDNETAQNWIRYSEEHELCFDNLGSVRKWLFLLLVSIFCHFMKLEPTALLKSYDLGIQALRLMWRSLPEPYFTLSEIQSVWIPDSDLNLYEPSAKHVYTLYKTKIIDCRNKDSDEEGPRSLQHLARCEIRGRLAANCALPDGIQLLGLPQPIQEFLSLES